MEEFENYADGLVKLPLRHQFFRRLLFEPAKALGFHRVGTAVGADGAIAAPTT